MTIINIRTATRHLSSPAEEAAAGPVQLEKSVFHAALGALKGRSNASEDFDAPLPAEILKGFGIDD